MLKSIFRVLFTLAFTLSLTFGVFAGFGTSMASAASSQPTAAEGYNPVASVPVDMSYCYPSGYNRQGWRCGWRLAMYPYNLGASYCNYGYNNCYNTGYNNCYNTGYSNCYNPCYNTGYSNCYGYNYGMGGYGYYPGSTITDYGGRPRFGPYYNNCNYPYYNSYCY